MPPSCSLALAQGSASLAAIGSSSHPRSKAFWLYNLGLLLWIALNFFPIGWPQLDAVHEHGLAYARRSAFYDGTLFWQWMRLPGDVLFAAGALLMAWDFIVKLRPLRPQGLAQRLSRGSGRAGQAFSPQAGE